MFTLLWSIEKVFAKQKKVNKITQGITLHINNLLQAIDIALLIALIEAFNFTITLVIIYFANIYPQTAVHSHITHTHTNIIVFKKYFKQSE